uniref:Uncharacterized protein n=1 Tax=Plectus sambesii TaxID=2011161 RepID=A0A914VI95_9BILA
APPFSSSLKGRRPPTQPARRRQPSEAFQRSQQATKTIAIGLFGSGGDRLGAADGGAETSLPLVTHLSTI